MPDHALSEKSASESIVVVFRADIKLDAEDVREAGGSLSQAVQNRIGHTGAAVLDIEDWER